MSHRLSVSVYAVDFGWPADHQTVVVLRRHSTIGDASVRSGQMVRHSDALKRTFRLDSFRRCIVMGIMLWTTKHSFSVEAEGLSSVRGSVDIFASLNPPEMYLP